MHEFAPTDDDKTNLCAIIKNSTNRIVTNKLKYEQKNYRIKVYVEEKGR